MLADAKASQFSGVGSAPLRYTKFMAGIDEVLYLPTLHTAVYTYAPVVGDSGSVLVLPADKARWSVKQRDTMASTVLHAIPKVTDQTHGQTVSHTPSHH